MEPELCAAVHHVIHDFDKNCFSETSLDFPDFQRTSFKTGFRKSLFGRDQSFDVDQSLHDKGLSLSLFMSAEATTTAEHTNHEHAT